MNRRPLVVFACFWLFGASVPSLWQGLEVTAACGSAALLLGGSWFSGRLSGRLACVSAMAMLLAFGERAWVDHAAQSELTSRWSANGVPEQTSLEGAIASPPEVDGDTATFRLAARRLEEGESTGIAIHETVMVRVKLKAKPEQETAGLWKRGDRVRVTGAPEQPGDAGNIGSFDYRRYLERQGVYWQWSVQGAESVQTAEGTVSWTTVPLRKIDELRARIGRLMGELYPGRDAGYMKGLVVGITDEIDPAQYDSFSRLGLTHVLAISGLHVAVVVFVLLRLGAVCRLTRERSIDIAFAAMPFYMLVTGASPSAVRACLMAMIALALARRNRLKDGLHLLAAAAILMTAWNPRVVEDVSFQLSFAVTAGLLLATSSVSTALGGVRPRFLRDALAVGITAQAISFPLTVYYFHGMHLLSLPANLLLVPFISFAVLPLGMASVVLGAAWLPLGAVPATLASYGNRITFGIVEYLNRAESLKTVWPQPSLIWVAAAYILIGLTVWRMRVREAVRREPETFSGAEEDSTVPLEDPTLLIEDEEISAPPRWRRVAAGGAVLLVWAGWLIWGYQPWFLDRNAYVEFLDVGQGDGILVRTGAGRHLLIDAGGTVVFRKPGDEWREKRDPYEVGRKLLVPLLKQRGVRTLDALVLTHLDADHIGGAEAVLREVPVRALIWNGTWKKNAGTERLFREAERRGIPVYAARAGMEWTLDESASLNVLFPSPSASAAGDAVPAALPLLDKQNENSVVLMLNLYGRRFLLTGDVEAPGEAAILRGESSGNPNPLAPVDVMKAGHHGSKTSTTPEWVARWKPAETVISVGRKNLYGHPNADVIARLSASGSALFRTDRNGEIRYRVTPGGVLWRQVKRVSAETNIRQGT
ncbi:DNA internalization-related competence protein ComEC/Rec2 [Cohnella candidum]|uniref:DNA internalization-related competence protein ComEC/Rec2 n=1 Tax=Cohnella candidum TaxID=2674991 RepID=A0A3G3JU28_9BACL|nr:DNA internalization-related competence protein ComEC/Rec2 [Cohnella candidum]AYQ71712.1 DNA internalization-related competence protein ComEC/Rec2 [Cohnella candidum]